MILNVRCVVWRLWAIFSLIKCVVSHPRMRPTDGMRLNLLGEPTNGPINASYPIMCFPSDLPDLNTTVEGCKSTLNILRSYRPYTKIQEFRMQYPPSPKSPKPPPYTVDDPTADCSILITVWLENAIGHFSWSQVKSLAQEVIQHCQDEGAGKGGTGLIGEPIPGYDAPGWAVVIVGRKMVPSPSMAGASVMSTTPAEIGVF